MKKIVSDWSLVREAEKQGLVAATSSMVKRYRTDENEKLSDYFREKYPKYEGVFGEDESEDVLYSVNEFLEEKGIDRHSIDFPVIGGTDIHLIPITDNLQLQLNVTDEYHGGGDYSKFTAMEYFIINENTTTSDVDKLLDFLQNKLTY